VDKPKVQFREPEELLRPCTDDNPRHELIREDLPELVNAPTTPTEVVPAEDAEAEKIRERLALREEYQQNPELGKAHRAALFPPRTKPLEPLTFEGYLTDAPPDPTFLPEISEEELDMIKCVQRSEQDEQWDRMSETERDAMRKRLFHGDHEWEPLRVADPQ